MLNAIERKKAIGIANDFLKWPLQLTERLKQRSLRSESFQYKTKKKLKKKINSKHITDNINRSKIKNKIFKRNE